MFKNLNKKFLIELSQARDATGESTDMLEGSCSQNILKNKRLEPWSYRQERDFIDRERLSGEAHSRAPEHWSGGHIYIYMASTLT
jgi:hypothetical protein